MSDCLDPVPFVTLKGKSVPLRCGKCPPCTKKLFENRERMAKKFKRLKEFKNVD